MGTRKVVTVIFADLAGSTALHERLDAESARLFMEGYTGGRYGQARFQSGLPDSNDLFMGLLQSRSRRRLIAFLPRGNRALAPCLPA